MQAFFSCLFILSLYLLSSPPIHAIHKPNPKQNISSTPRCGVADTAPAIPTAVYFTGRPRWARPIPIKLTYAFFTQNTITSLSPEQLQATFKLAFSHWASVIPVSFSQSDDYGFADIKIGFYSGDHGDGEPFDGVLGVLAHAFSPESGRLHLDAAEAWAVDFASEKSDVAVDLESVATHEIGHLLGLAHTDVREAVMYPSLKPREKKVDLKVDDVRGIQALYGSNPNFSFNAFSESELSWGGEEGDVGWVMVMVMVIYAMVMLCM